MLELVEEEHGDEDALVGSAEVALAQVLRERLDELVTLGELKVAFVQSFVIDVLVDLFL
jgi:hypothetical protein